MFVLLSLRGLLCPLWLIFVFIQSDRLGQFLGQRVGSVAGLATCRPRPRHRMIVAETAIETARKSSPPWNEPVLVST